MATGTGIFLGFLVLSAVMIILYVCSQIAAKKRDGRRRVEEIIEGLKLRVAVIPLLWDYEDQRRLGTMIQLDASGLGRLREVEPYATTITLKHRDAFNHVVGLRCDPKAHGLSWLIDDDSQKWPDQALEEIIVPRAILTRRPVTAWVNRGDTFVIIDPFGEVSAEMIRKDGLTFNVWGMEFVYYPTRVEDWNARDIHWL